MTAAILLPLLLPPPLLLLVVVVPGAVSAAVAAAAAAVSASFTSCSGAEVNSVAGYTCSSNTPCNSCYKHTVRNEEYGGLPNKPARLLHAQP
jgi:hypothetical protein